MSKELIQDLRMFSKYVGPEIAKAINEAADALEAKAAPVGEREAFEVYLKDCAEHGIEPSPAGAFVSAFQAGAAYQRAQQPQSAEAVGEVKLQHMAIAEDGCLRWMTGRKIDNCYLYAMPDFGRAPKLYTTPQPIAGVVMPERRNEGHGGEWSLKSEGWNACLDEFARLNGKEVGRE